MIRSVIKEGARRDLLEACDWYMNQFEDGDLELLREFSELMLKIEQFPQSYPVVEGEYRRAIMRRFPYGVFYFVEREVVYVIAFMHNHRDPDVWRART